jgi:indole-3-glycerol phosphate synthase
MLARGVESRRVITYLDRILEVHRETAAADPRPLDALVTAAVAQPECRGFRHAIERSSTERLAVVAEIKRRSPSKGDLRPDLDAADLARSYSAGGATCLSVLTDRHFFGGSAVDLATAREVTALPVLRKDFTVSGHDVCDARLMGADCVLLIAAALDRGELRDLLRLATDVGLDALVEVHDEAELDDAVELGADLIGVNQRDLVTFEVDGDRAARLAGRLPRGVVKVAESGVRHALDAARLRDAGYDAVLVGESLVTAADPAAAIRALTGGP